MSPKPKPPTANQAFERATAGYQFGGKPLQKFTAQRQAAVATMGLRFGMVDAADIFTVTVETLRKRKKVQTDLQFYNQMFADVVTTIWLCTVPASRADKALRKPEEARGDAFKWADSEGITLTSERYYEAAGVFFSIMQDISVSTAVPVAGKDQEETDDDDPNE